MPEASAGAGWGHNRYVRTYFLTAHTICQQYRLRCEYIKRAEMVLHTSQVHRSLASHPWQPAVFLSDASGDFGGETLVVGAEEDVVVGHQRGAADGHEPARGIHLPPYDIR